MSDYIFKNIGGHIEVYDMRGNFIFSADNEMEAASDLELLFDI